LNSPPGFKKNTPQQKVQKNIRKKKKKKTSESHIYIGGQKTIDRINNVGKRDETKYSSFREHNIARTTFEWLV
jgi:hypothetical protein